MGDDRLTQDEIALVLQRAAELDAAATTAPDEGIALTALEAGAAEVGLAPAAVHQAVAELRAGMLEPGSEGRARAVVARAVPLPVAEACDRVARYLRRQLFVQARDRGAVQVWRPREDFVASIQRGLDFAAAVRLAPMSEVVVRVVEIDGGSLVRLEGVYKAGFLNTPRFVGGGFAIAGIAGGAVATALGEPLIGLWAGTSGAATGGAGYAIARRSVRGSAHKAVESLEGFLDKLERGEAPRRVPSRRQRWS